MKSNASSNPIYSITPRNTKPSPTHGGGPAPDPGKFILLNSQRFPIFENLFAALLRLRQTSKPRMIWIDAICINQSMAQEAVREREQQILLMKRIYEQARQVVIWLGDTGIGERIAMQSLANPSGSFSLATNIWKTERKFGLGKGLKNRISQGLTGEWDPKALEVGELAQLLDRKWWRRVWIVQEVVLARKAVIMCGPDEVPWEAITKRMRDDVYGILGQDRNQRAKHTDEGSVIAKYAFPDAEYITLMALQEKWRSKTWDQTFSKDSEPFPSLIDEEPRYWASGKARQVHFASGYDSDSQTLKLTGVLFDKIVSLARPWCPELHLLPIDRLENKTLQEWEDLATIPVPNCPYEKSGGRYNAYWRTHIADYASARSATDKDKNYFETWANRGAWVSRVQDSFSATDKSSWQKNIETPMEQQIMNNMWDYMIEKGYDIPSLNPTTNLKLMSESRTKYKELRKRIHSASIGRAMFVTSKGFIGLGPWNAREGDVISPLSSFIVVLSLVLDPPMKEFSYETRIGHLTKLFSDSGMRAVTHIHSQEIARAEADFVSNCTVQRTISLRGMRFVAQLASSRFRKRLSTWPHPPGFVETRGRRATSVNFIRNEVIGLVEANNQPVKKG
ncbi:hypothetical protein N431DRAFT_564401 [Stipitochalara longipes BDJ]|nr:hypothetical protein N431DRAFT_564401 [Stipitochalara longipes BDJ]